MASVELHAYAAASETARNSGGFIASGSSTPLDVSTHAVLRQTIRVDCNHGSTPQAKLFLETGPTASGPWAIAWQRHMVAGTPPGNDPNGAGWSSAPRAVFVADAFARLRWEVSGGNEGVALSIGCTGTGIGSGS